MNYSLIDRILVGGSIAYDEIMNFPGYFKDYFQKEKLHQISVSFVVDKLVKQLGGTATNIAYNLSLINNSNIYILSSIGKDGKVFIDFFKNKNINTDGIIKTDSFYTATGKVITDKKDNQIWGYYYGALLMGKRITIKKFITRNSLFILSANHSDSFLHFQKECIEQKQIYMYDPGMTLTWIKKKDLENGIYHSKWLVGNDYEISIILKNLHIKVKDLVQKGIAVITTLGEKGVRYQDSEYNYLVPAYFSKKIKDPTGAGDAWRAGFVGALTKGKTIKESLGYGNALASFAIEKYGTVNHHPSTKEINKRVNQIIN